MGGELWAQPREDGGSEFGFSLVRYPDELDGADQAGRVRTGSGSTAGVETSSPA